MKKNPAIIILVIAIIAVIVGFYLLSNSKDQENIQPVENSEEMQVQESENVTESQELSTMNTGTETETEKVTNQTNGPGVYTNYSPEIISANSNKKIVLFFHASWCPSCRRLDGDINNNLGNIPNDVIILKTDYDTSTELKQKYGITSQHTLVKIDNQGNQLQKWSGGSRLSSIIEKL